MWKWTHCKELLQNMRKCQSQSKSYVAVILFRRSANFYIDVGGKIVKFDKNIINLLLLKSKHFDRNEKGYVYPLTFAYALTTSMFRVI